MSIQAVFTCQLYIMCAYCVFAWFPEKYVGSILGLIKMTWGLGGLPVTTFYRRSTMTDNSVKNTMFILIGLLAIDLIVNMKFLYEHP